MAKIFVTSGSTVFRLLENPYMKEYQKGLASGRKYKLPNREVIVNTTLPILHSKLVGQKEAEAQELEGGTLSLDGWTDISGDSVYAVLIVVKNKHI